MKTVIKGQKYIFDIYADEGEFYIRALHRASLRFSCINNLNAVLSELDIEENDVERNREYEDSWWSVSKEEGRSFFRKAVKFLHDKYFRAYLERKLDEDRYEGEWENRERVRRKESVRSE